MSVSGSMTNVLGVKDVFCHSVWRALAAECVGTFFLVLLACGSTSSGWSEDYAPSVLHIALCFGLTVAAMVQVTGHVSGGHLNPAVTVGLLVSGQVTLYHAVLYILAQCVGAIAGAGVLQAVTPEEISSLGLGSTSLGRSMTALQGLIVEALITAVLVFVVHAVCDLGKKDSECKLIAASPGPLAIGLAVGTCHLLAVPYTGSGMNPARSLGPAAFSGAWENHWVYWIGPILGAICSAIVYKYVLTERKRVEDVLPREHEMVRL